MRITDLTATIIPITTITTMTTKTTIAIITSTKAITSINGNNNKDRIKGTAITWQTTFSRA